MSWRPGSSSAIVDANGSPDASETIAFNIPGDGVHVIAPLSALPDLRFLSGVVDGYTQPGAAPSSISTETASLRVELDGRQSGGADGLNLRPSETVRGLSVYGFNRGIVVNGDDVVEGCFIGVAADGKTVVGNTSWGIFASGFSNTIGGATAAARNLLCGNGTADVGNSGAINLFGGGVDYVLGNLVGTDPTGSFALGMNTQGIIVGSGSERNTIGGDRPNVVVGSRFSGIDIDNRVNFFRSGNTISGNIVGMDATRTSVVPNGGAAIFVLGSSNTVVGNTISGDKGTGIVVTGKTSVGNRVIGNTVGFTQPVFFDPSRQLSIGIILEGARGTTVGGTAAGEANTISGTNVGIQLNEFAASNLVIGNEIGTRPFTGFSTPSNNIGIALYSGTSSSGALGNTIGGAGLAGNVVIASRDTGIYLQSVSGNLVIGNLVGTDRLGTAGLGNARYGILIEDESVANTIGGPAAGAGNVSVANGFDGVGIFGKNSRGNVVEGNILGMVGPASAGSPRMGNTFRGVYNQDATGTVIRNNHIEANRVSGVTVTRTGEDEPFGDVTIVGNDIRDNDSSGVTLNDFAARVVITGNTIAGNRPNGLEIGTNFVHDVTISGNRFGIVVGGPGGATLGNIGDGIVVRGIEILIGGDGPAAANVIAYNSRAGVRVVTDPSGNRLSRFRVLGNATFGNVGAGLLDGDIATVGSPTIASALSGPGGTAVSGRFVGEAGTTYVIVLFTNSAPRDPGREQGQIPVGRVEVVVGPDGNGTFSTILPQLAPGVLLTANTTGNSPLAIHAIRSVGTSPFSTAVAVKAAPTIPDPTPTPAPTVIATVRLGRSTVKKRKVDVVVVTAGGALDAGDAGSLSAFLLTRAGKGGRRIVVPLASALVDPSRREIRLVPKGPLPRGTALKLLVRGDRLRDATGRPIDGDRDGRPGGDLVATVSKPR